MAITPDSIPSSEQIQETLFDRIYYPYQKQILLAAAILTVAILTVLGLRQHNETRENEMWARYYALLEGPGQGPQVERERAESLEEFVAEFPADSVTPHALRSAAYGYARARAWDKSLELINRLGEEYPDYDIFKLARSGSATPQTVADWFEETVEKERDWEQKSRYEPRWPNEDRLALVETNLGSLWIGFFEGDAPQHVAKFVERAKKGLFNGTQFYENRRGTSGASQLLLGGSDASKQMWTEPWEHDRDEPQSTEQPEAARFELRHLRRIVSAVKMDSGESSAAFMITTSPEGFRRYDGQTTPFGAVMEREGSIAAMDAIAAAPTYDRNPDTKDAEGTLRVREHPYPYVVIRRVSIWKNEALEPGHDWDTSRTASDKPEPWEAELAPAWKPETVKKDDEAGGGGDKPDEPEKPDDAEKPDEPQPPKEPGDDASAGEKAK